MSQRQAHDPHESDALLRACRQRAFLGTFRIRLDNIQSCELSCRDKRHVKRLRVIFEAQGCLRHEPVNFIDATISATTWVASSARNRDRQHDLTLFPELTLMLEESVVCISGKCRIAAAQQILETTDRWWIAALYRAEVAGPIIQHWRCWSSHEQHPSRGGTYLLARSYHHTLEKKKESQALKNLTPHMERAIKRLWKYRPQLAAGLDQCSRWTSLWCTVNLGVIHKVIAAKCDEEYVRYLDAVSAFWKTVSADGHIAVSEGMIRAFQGRCPYFSESDRRYVQRMLETDHFVSLLDNEARAHVFSQVVRYPMTIPSLLTFFEDHKYIALCGKALRLLLGRDRLDRRATLRHYFSQKYNFRDEVIIQSDSTSFTSVPWNHAGDAFSWAYCQLWLCSMRLWPFVLDEKPRKAERGAPSSFSRVNPESCLVELARTAKHLGFHSSAIDSMAAHDVAPRTSANQAHTGFVTQEEPEEFRFAQRCGIPFDDAATMTTDDLYIDKLLSSELVPGADLTPLFITRVFFQRLFPESGRLNVAISTTHAHLGGILLQG